MKTTAILVAVAMIAMVTPTQATTLEPVDNTEFFKQITLEAFENQKNDAIGVPTPTFEEEDLDWDGLFAALEARANGRDMEALFAGAETGAFPQAGEWLELFELSISSANECPTPDVAESDPLAGTHAWSYGSAEYIGVANSDVSTISGLGLFVDYSTGKAFTYSQAVTYGGSSDFYCFAFDFFGIFLTYNWPWMTGAVVDGL